MSEAGVWIELYDLAMGEHDEWRSWYDSTYLEPRVAVGGVSAARRCRGVVDRIPHPVPAAAPLEIALYELTDVAATTSEEWQAIGQGAGDAAQRAIVSGGSGALYRQLSSTDQPYRPAPAAEILHGAFFEVPARHHDEFNAWYDLEHVPEQLTVRGYLNARRFQGVVEPDRFVALYDVTALEATESRTASAAMSSPWGDRVRHQLVRARARRLFRIERLELAAGGVASG
jgi:hypothetical protein